jgi:DNA-binding CsgD family transcriptional regulator
MSIILDEINYNAFSYNKNILDKLITICEPLFASKITTFAYFRFFENGRYLYLCNDAKWVEYCLQNVQDNNTALGQEICHAKQDEFYCFLWPTTPKDELLTALYNFDIWNGLSIFKKLQDSVELWGFASSRESHFMPNFYINNIENLKDFTRLFNQKAKILIDTTDQNKLAIYKNAVHDSYNFNDPYISKQINSFILATDIKKYPIITSKGEVFLSMRERQCLNYLSFGKTAKEIGKELNISYRSVELYLQNVKSKLGYSKKSEVIAAYKKSYKDWF